MPTATVTERRIESLLELHLRPSLFIPELKNKRKSAVLEEMTAHLAAHKVARQADPVLEVLRHREALGSTGIGKGIAIPHARSTMVAERAVLLARSAKGVDFDAVDGNPVHLCFLIVAPPTEQDPIYLQLLAEIVKSIRLAPVRKRILEAQDLDQIRTIIGGQLGND
ncbi:MAG TPA: PTS sugar transporter subunit IIA [Candidatus Limnocylindrales bacterium]|nr:PTS sugar transporter subunit IIA [Candidatus Limnocylindrales bacterium]